MKLEKINENSIRCTIGKKEIEDYKLELREIVSGEGNAPKFFRDIIIRAHEEFGFEPNDKPLVIEATASMPGNIVFTITKVDDMSNIDKVSKMISRQREDDIKKSIHNKMKEAFGNWALGSGDFEDAVGDSVGNEEDVSDEACVYFFRDTKNLIKVAKQLKGIFDGNSYLYEFGDGFVVILDDLDVDTTVYEYSVDILSEYADKTEFSDLYESMIKEHCNLIIDKDALDKLAEI